MPANNDKASKKIESLIAEPLALRLGVDQTTALPSSTKLIAIAQRPYTQPSLNPETDAIAAALRAICQSATTRFQFQWQGRAHRLLGPDPTSSGHGTQLITIRPGAFIGAQIVVEPVDNEGQHIYVKYALVKNGKHIDGEPRYFLECEGNPTTLLTGNNVLPVTVRNAATGLEEAYPSSSHRAMMTVNRALFVFLEQLARQVTGSQAALFGPETLRIITSCDFDVVHIQCCCYFPADVSRFLRMLVAIYGPLASTEEGFSTVAEQIGLDFSHVKDKQKRVTGVLFEKRYGANAVWSVVAYNKQKRLAQMKQGKTLEPDEQELIQHNVRLDMTAHGPAIIQIIKDARRSLRKHREATPHFLTNQFADEFLNGEPKKTMRWLDFAVFVLSHRLVGRRIVRGFLRELPGPQDHNRCSPPGCHHWVDGRAAASIRGVKTSGRRGVAQA